MNNYRKFKAENASLRRDSIRILKEKAKLQADRDRLKRRTDDTIRMHNALMRTYANLQEAYDKLNKQQSERDAQSKTDMNELETLRELTKGHTTANLKAIMDAAPSAEECEGHTWRYGYPQSGEMFWKGGEMCQAVKDINIERHLIRTPIVEYIEGDDITDELLQKHGRLPCEVWPLESGEWEDATLYRVCPAVPGIASTFEVVVHKEKRITTWANCRIKRSDIPEA